MLGSGKELGIKHLEYGYQEGEGGIAAALSIAEDFAEGRPIMVVLGDNFTDADLGPAVKDFEEARISFSRKSPIPASTASPCSMRTTHPASSPSRRSPRFPRVSMP